MIFETLCPATYFYDFIKDQVDDDIQLGECAKILNFKVNNFPVWLPNRLLSAELEPVVRLTEKSYV